MLHGDLLNPQDSFCFAPELVELIVIAFRRTENVHDNVAIVQQHPAGVQRSLAVMGQDALFLQGLLYFIADGTYLPCALAGTNNKIVRETA